MALDRYSKVIFTAIAVALTALAVGQFMPGPVVAQHADVTNSYKLAGGSTGAWIIDAHGAITHCVYSDSNSSCRSVQ